MGRCRDAILHMSAKMTSRKLTLSEKLSSIISDLYHYITTGRPTPLRFVIDLSQPVSESGELIAETKADFNNRMRKEGKGTLCL